jgi:hypothetical protein
MVLILAYTALAVVLVVALAFAADGFSEEP